MLTGSSEDHSQNCRPGTHASGLSRKLGHVQFFSANRVLNHHSWALLDQGEVFRAYAWAGETLGNQGPLTAAEKDGFVSPRGYVVRGKARRALSKDRDAADDQLLDDVVDACIDAEAYRWQTFLTVTRMIDGEQLGAEASLTKVFWSELDIRLHETALQLLGPDAEVDETGWMKGYEFALSGPIYAGTNEIQRNVIAERVLGLPRI